MGNYLIDWILDDFVGNNDFEIDWLIDVFGVRILRNCENLLEIKFDLIFILYLILILLIAILFFQFHPL
jgi:hypothetical protein